MFYKLVDKFAFRDFSIWVAFGFILVSSSSILSCIARIAPSEKLKNIREIFSKIVST